MGNSTTSTTRLDIRFTDTTTYSATSNHVNGLKIFNDSNTDNGFAGIELAATDGDDYYGSVLLKAIADGTNYSNDFVIQTRHGGNYGERFRIDSTGSATFYTSQVKLYNNVDNSNTYFYAENTSNGNAGIKLKNSDGEWTIIANDRLRFIDDDASTERFSIDSSGHVQLRQKSSEGSAQQKLQWISNSGSLSSQIAWGQGSANFDFSVFRTDSQTNYPYGNFRVLTGHGTSPTEALKVTVGGQVLKARHPFFSGLQYAGTGSVPQTGINNWTFTNIEINQGNHFNNSTGYFTCPVAGKYAVMAMHNHRASGGSWSSVYIMKNSTTISDSWQSSALNETHVPLSASHILSCSANDTISLGWHSSYSAPTTGGTRGNALAIWLIG